MLIFHYIASYKTLFRTNSECTYSWRFITSHIPSRHGKETRQGRRIQPCHLRLRRLRPAQLRLLSPPITTLSSCSSLPMIRSRTRAQSASLQSPGSVCKHRRFALLKRSYKANQPERNSRLLVVRLILTLVRFASLSVRTDPWGPLVASLLVEKTQRTLLDIKLTSKWFGLPRTTLSRPQSTENATI